MPEPTITTRLAGPDDRPILAGLEAVLRSRAEPDFVDLLFETIAAGHRDLLFGFIDGRPAGYAVVNWRSLYAPFAALKIPELQDLNVLPDARRHGLGRAIVAACEELARARKCSDLGLAVGLDRSYGPAQRLYVRLGYEPDGAGVTYDRAVITPGTAYPVDDDLCLMMVKKLA